MAYFKGWVKGDFNNYLELFSYIFRNGKNSVTVRALYLPVL